MIDRDELARALDARLARRHREAHDYPLEEAPPCVPVALRTKETRGLRQDDRGRDGLDRYWLVNGTEDEREPRRKSEVAL